MTLGRAVGAFCDRDDQVLAFDFRVDDGTHGAAARLDAAIQLAVLLDDLHPLRPGARGEVRVRSQRPRNGFLACGNAGSARQAEGDD